MTCADKRVKCHIVTLDGEVFTGTNDCLSPQKTCPRLPGEGYEKCKSICNQPGHAEEMALKAAGDKARGADIYLEGIGWYCRKCQEALFKAGIRGLFIGRPV